jgi:drug/metabolite transporter (DMT)-like permease
MHAGLGLLLGFVGVAAIAGLNVEGASAVALAEIGVVVICYAVGPVIVQRQLAGLPALGVTAVALTLTALVYVPIAAFSFPHERPSPEALGSILGLAIVCTALAFLLFFALIEEIGPVRATVITYVNPAVAAVLGVVVLDERFTASMALGFVLVLVGSVLATRPPRVPAPVATGVPEPVESSAGLTRRATAGARRERLEVHDELTP